ncbi:MAG: TrmH family RNA methyltransferase [Myxococcota bacterium]
MSDARTRVSGAAEVGRALDEQRLVRRLVVAEDAEPALAELVSRAEASGVPVDRVAGNRQRRLLGDAEIAALVGPDVDAPLDAVMARGGAVWLLVGTAYAGNIGTAVRTAEVSGADGVYVDNGFDHEQRRETRRASMRADRFLPFAWESAGEVLGAARRAGKRIVGVEDSGALAPWECALAESVLCVVGGESEGVPPTLLRRCDDVVRIPMSGFVTSYNLQAAVAMLAAERLRQLGNASV